MPRGNSAGGAGEQLFANNLTLRCCIFFLLTSYLALEGDSRQMSFSAGKAVCLLIFFRASAAPQLRRRAVPGYSMLHVNPANNRYRPTSPPEQFRSRQQVSPLLPALPETIPQDRVASLFATIKRLK